MKWEWEPREAVITHKIGVHDRMLELDSSDILSTRTSHNWTAEPRDGITNVPTKDQRNNHQATNQAQI
jgi:hypothetical protein